MDMRLRKFMEAFNGVATEIPTKLFKLVLGARKNKEYHRQNDNPS